MQARTFSSRARRGVTTVECGVVYSITLLLIMGTIIEGLGVFRYEQLSSLAREGARWASVHGPTYQQEKNQPAPTSQDVYNNVIAPEMVALNATQLTTTLTMTANTASVTLTYVWTPEGLFSPMTLTSKSVLPITY